MAMRFKMLLDRVRAEWPVLAALCLLSAIALVAGLPPGAVSGAVALVVLALFLKPQPAPRLEEQGPVAPVVDDRPKSLPETAMVLAALDFPVILFDRDEIIAFQNAPAQRLFGDIGEQTYVAARFRQPSMLDAVRDMMRSGEPCEIEYIERLPAERRFVIHCAQIAPGFFLMAFRDTTETLAIDRMRTDFVANASHELRTPLASLRGFIETLLGPARNDEKARERFLGIMLDQVTRMSRLVDDLLSLSRLEQKAHIPPTENVDLRPLLEHVCDSLQPLASDLGVELRLDKSDGPVIVQADRDQLIQVFENLVENACKYGQDGKVVDIILSGGATPSVKVCDYGPGIDRDHLPRLTERFYRVNVEASRSRKGTGLGLAIVKHILTRHRARLIVRSEPGQGAEFCVQFGAEGKTSAKK